LFSFGGFLGYGRHDVTHSFPPYDPTTSTRRGQSLRKQNTSQNKQKKRWKAWTQGQDNVRRSRAEYGRTCRSSGGGRPVRGGQGVYSQEAC
jgi:hypothetical protein